MNAAQNTYAVADNSLGHLLVQIDTFYQDLPEAVRSAFDKLGSSAKFGCHCDLEEGQSPDGCVLDEGRAQDCVHARTGQSKASCEYWQPIAFKL